MHRRTFHAFLLATGLALHGLAAATPKSDCEALMSAVLPFAEQRLSLHGAFYPYGAAMDPTGKVAQVGAYDGTEHPKSADVMKLLRGAFTAGAASGKYKATAMVYDVKVTLPSSGQKSDAIAIALDHREGYSVVVYQAYRLQDGKFVAGEMFAERGEGLVFK